MCQKVGISGAGKLLYGFLLSKVTCISSQPKILMLPQGMDIRVSYKVFLKKVSPTKILFFAEH